MDEIEYYYGAGAVDMVRPFMHGQIPLAPVTYMVGADGLQTPVRAFGNLSDSDIPQWWDQIYNNLGWDFVDPYRKTFKVLDFQYWLTNLGRVFIDLETGDKKCLWHAQQVGNPLVVQTMPIKLIPRSCGRAEFPFLDRPVPKQHSSGGKDGTRLPWAVASGTTAGEPSADIACPRIRTFACRIGDGTRAPAS
jgi:hypothetical protein